ncbi:hypothetical protein GCM10010909_00940 [Acidocella aquatica]|uniref:Type II toxin-antitoxin system RelE/ParE family toxin n=1 Tax=Acidocella aquatica TaxID=1922313 RepID=A0ABQ6A3E0_9PROT|nr:hypothetical protein [Acidocella aquatica]GLR65416.1 hypothetical protein GCM10010909_00940 [Acidocella aquatica]
MPELKLTEDAERQFWSLELNYTLKGYDLALLRLFAAVDFAIEPANLSRHLFVPAPRPAPELATLGQRWMLHNRYRFAYSSEQPPMITAIIYANLDIMRHTNHLLPRV